MPIPQFSQNYRCVLVCGGSGFIGSHLIAKLSAAGARVIVPTRRYERAKHLIFLPRVEVSEVNIHDDAALRQLMRLTGVSAVINLVGLLHSRPGQPYGPDFASAHVELPRRLAAACVELGIARLLHMSALGASANGPSMYLRSKADGEQATRAGGALAPTIFRPSVVFGPGDSFLTLFAAMQKFLPVVPLGRADARFQPVYVEDVAEAFVRALHNPNSHGQVYELAGPQILTLRELVQLAGPHAGHARPVWGLPPALARLQAWFLEHMPGGPLMSRDNLASMQTDNVIAPNAQALTAAALGIKLTPLDAVVRHYLGPPLSRIDPFRTRARR